MPSPRRFLILIALGAVAVGFAPSSIQFLFIAGLVVGLTLFCLKEAPMCDKPRRVRRRRFVTILRPKKARRAEVRS
ncbi:hypothetical protein [Propionibacterium freudenreichii]|uniref:hypothetical protein n=1 Tax=Propionibacterium freudenreichii TaxID=1744 RepID=UPI0021A971F7|nr:hypothetical protein [Propionibacterium freudenreichii]MCT2990956.1 hypothetical protein [Propionibacterium freudenreichii]